MAKDKEKIYTIHNGRVKMLDAGYKATQDALLLAGAADCRGAKTILDAGVGTGGAILPILSEYPKIKATGLDISEESLALCARNAKLNGREIELIKADITKWKTSRQFDIVISNPPFFKGAGRSEHHGADLAAWTAACARRMKPRGKIYMIVDAAAYAEIIRALPAAVGGITIKPIFSNKNSAERAIISARLGTKEPGKIILT
ncbi:MAG: methyltransferase [Rickettsiales bacterium]|jgi:tRNA1(Val) A37 N6-methylase TrmN6|nr:methyltransferase [Rickettsiales bacterium]